MASRLERWRRQYDPPSEGRPAAIFHEWMQVLQASTDRIFFFLLPVQYGAAILAALLWSPLAWAGTRSSIHLHVWLAIGFGGLLTALPMYQIRLNPGAALTRHVTAVGQMLMGALLIHLTGGRIETHFHIFGSLAILAFYRDIRVLATATLVVALDHLIRGLLMPQSIYGVLTVSNWRFAEHTLWALFEDVFLCLACLNSRAQLGTMSVQRAELEAVNGKIETAVRARTLELSQRTEELASARDAAMESTRLKSQFLANVSHEIRTPMNGVLGMTSLLLETGLNSDQQEFAVIVQRSAEALMTIINDILDCSKIEAGKIVIEHATFPLHATIEDAVQLLAATADRKELGLICDIDGAVPTLVKGDSGRLRQILVNLIGNAVKFTGEGEVIVRARKSVMGVRFEVSDTGIGISEQARRSLFQAFVQGDGSSKRKYEGTGLGLAISKQLVLLMGGEIGVESKAGAGSTFWAELPLEAVADKAPARPIDLRGLRVLIAGGSAAECAALRRALQSWSATAETAADSIQALALLELAHTRHEPFHAALVDAAIGDEGGPELARIIQQRPHLLPLKIVFLTSLSNRAEVSPALIKPVRRELLGLTLAKLSGNVSAAGAEPSRPVRAAMPVSRRLRVLVAEDNAVNQRVVSGMLRKLGHAHDIASDGLEAIGEAARQQYDLILMDCQMPRLDGFEATAEIRKLPGTLGRVPIIALTANAMQGDRERCIAAGMNGYLAKPIRIENLQEALNQFVPSPEIPDEETASLDRR